MNISLISSLAGVLARFEGATAQADIFQELRETLRPLGYRHILITGLPFLQDGPWYREVLYDGWPREWFQHYTHCGHFAHDPCAQRSRYADRPFFWSELPNDDMSPLGQRVMGEATEFGLRNGLCVPIHGPLHTPTVVTAAGEHIDTLRLNLPVLETVCVSAFRAIRRLHPGDDSASQGKLTPREREILTWTAAGKAAEDIACILSISRFTVERHLRNIREKLGASNTVHAAVEAVRRREIRP